MSNFPIQYHEPVFRPPSEWKSLIIQLTLGCSWNNCAFCEMYTSKQFRARKEEDIFHDIDAFIPHAYQIRRVFLADGDPLVLSTNRLIRILNHLKNTFPRLQRVSAYASPNNLIRKSISELEDLKNAGLNLLFVGLESGDDEVLSMINKGETSKSMIEGLNKSKLAGLDSSVMIINGVGGKQYTFQHALNSAAIINEIQPKYLSTLVLTAYKGMDYLKSRLNVDFTELNEQELVQEMRQFIEHLQLKETIFRSDHASNHLILKGVLGRDKEKFIAKIDSI
ncbi:MAG: radical SAM protein [Bacteroidales bacterium]|nr:radical SAM protein [Bacteroidales bacterium]